MLKEEQDKLSLLKNIIIACIQYKSEALWARNEILLKSATKSLEIAEQEYAIEINKINKNK
jgi:hypothetical protein